MLILKQDNKEVLIIKSVLVRISDDDHQKLRIKTAQQRTSAQELLENFIKSYINDDKSKDILKNK